MKSFEEVRKELGLRQKQVYDKLKEMKFATNTMLSHVIGIPINSITPRVYELRQQKLVGVSHIGKCPITGRNAIFWKCVK